jgi:hypothetical protein
MRILLIAALLFVSSTLFHNPIILQHGSRPKLVECIAVDQMQWDYLYRYYDRYGNVDLRVLNGALGEHPYQHIPAVSAVGHTVIYTGSVLPSVELWVTGWTTLTGRTLYCT